MNTYQERRLQELRKMTTEEAAGCKIRATTPPRVKAMILRAREKTEGGKGKKKPHSSPPKDLKDGDVLLMRNNGTFWQNLISGVTRSPYTLQLSIEELFR
jgi:hypothetical protein